jgi:hypothetical protein
MDSQSLQPLRRKGPEKTLHCLDRRLLGPPKESIADGFLQEVGGILKDAGVSDIDERMD